MTELDIRKAFVKVETEDQVYYGLLNGHGDDFIMLQHVVITSPVNKYLGDVLIPNRRVRIIYEDIRHQTTRMRIAEALNKEEVEINV